jgi:hypothetical protein
VLEERRCSRPKPYAKMSPPGWCLILLIWLATSPLTHSSSSSAAVRVSRRRTCDAVEAVGDRAALARGGLPGPDLVCGAAEDDRAGGGELLYDQVASSSSM